ncbi:hypothetical protein SNEBB_005652, partial [Seison nebaliae]
MILYRRYFVDSTVYDNRQRIFNSPYAVGPITNNNLESNDLSESEISLISEGSIHYYKQIAYMLTRREFLFLFRSVLTFTARLEERYLEIQEILHEYD